MLSYGVGRSLAGNPCGCGCGIHRLADAAPILPLAWELPYAAGAAEKKKKKERKKKEKFG